MMIIKSFKELFDSIFQEYQERRPDNSFFELRDCFAFAYVDKYFSPLQIHQFCVELIYLILEKAKQERSFLQSQPYLEYEQLFQHSQSLSPFYLIFRFIEAKLGKLIAEKELLALLSFYQSPNRQKYRPPHQRKSETIDLNSEVLNPSPVLHLLRIYTRGKPLSPPLQNGLRHLKQSLRKDWVHLKEEIDYLLETTGLDFSPSPEKTQKAPLELMAILEHKKWQWLRDQPLDFIPDRQEFYQLLVDLSQINYHHVQALSEEMQARISTIDSSAFELFLLDLYNAIRQEGNKRSSWFMTDKAEAFKIFVWLLYKLEGP
ncbi:MAG: hypothetical protein AAFU64_14555, partial [Bacteroidota bacterium]